MTIHKQTNSEVGPRSKSALTVKELPPYVVISPARDEEQFIGKMLDSMASQTVRPLRWILVDDGSGDRTPEIIENYARRHDWITLLSKQLNVARNPRPAVVHAFNAGYEVVRDLEFEIVVKLDTDLELPPDYFEKLLLRFDQNERLGIASGVYYEESNDGLRMIQMPNYHAAGASKVIRRKCYEQIGGFVPTAGWDTIDEIRAQMKGWETRHYEDVPFRHLRPEGSAIGRLRTLNANGKTYYLLGGGKFFFFLKCLRYSVVAEPFFWAGMEMMKGYLCAWLNGGNRAVNDQEARYYRSMLRGRLFRFLSNPSKEFR
jgi:poly-beta-1,6-N-acetyl-D-glucosamine synthase